MTDIQKIIGHYFSTKGFSSEQIKEDTRKRKIIYSRFTRPAKDLLELAGSVQKAKSAISKVALWAKSRDLDYTIETVFKKWFELDTLKPKEIKKKAFYYGKPMFWDGVKKKWFVIDGGEWLEFAGDKKDIVWK